ncbi:MAG: metal-dependent hydrolase [Nanoarchaeota archaeon]|nr:metal-dependent hydrolase [Nanoarchaeota archaeon]MBU1103487.1 metal-dependent hydrolase [Nanoarchaeota archaeon]
MLRRTHLALGLAVALYFVPYIKTNRLIFFAVVILASMIPDLESGFSAPKRHRLLSLQPTSFIFHRNLIFHSYTLLIPVVIVITFLYPPLAFPVFLGYSFHLFLDSFSPRGIRPFWPLKSCAKGNIQPGGRIDKILFYVFLIFDFGLFVKLFI